MTNVELLAELRTAPSTKDGVDRDTLYDWFFSNDAPGLGNDAYHMLRREFLARSWNLNAIHALLPDAITEAIEYLERQVAIEGCRYLNGRKKQHGVYAYDIHTDNPRCGTCPAELHGTDWI